MKKVVLMLDLHDDRAKSKAMKTVSGLSGIDSISMDMKEKKLTVTGDVDPVIIVGKLRKRFHTEILSVGPAKEPEKKKEEPKKDEAKKKDDGKKKDSNEQTKDLATAYKLYYSHMPPQPHYVYSVEENPNACVIC